MADYTEDFSGTGSPIAGNWAEERVARHFNTSAGTAVPADLSLDAADFYNQATGADQYSQAAVSVTGTSAGSGIGVSVRNDPTPGTGNLYRVVVSKAGSNNIALRRVIADASSTTGLSASDWTVTWVDGDILRVEVSGAGATVTLVIKQNGTTIATVTDTNAARLLSGRAGICYSSTATSASVDNWAGGDLSAGPAALPFITTLGGYRLGY